MAPRITYPNVSRGGSLTAAEIVSRLATIDQRPVTIAEGDQIAAIENKADKSEVGDTTVNLVTLWDNF